DAMRRRRAAHVGYDNTHPRWRRPRIDKGLRTAAAVLVVGVACHAARLVVGRMLGIEQLDRRAGHDGRDRVLVDQLRLRIAPEQQAEIVEPGDDALQLY